MLLIIGVTTVVGVLTLVFILICWRMQDQGIPERDRRFKVKPTQPDGDQHGVESGAARSDD